MSCGFRSRCGVRAPASCGNAVGSGIVVDTRRFDRVLDIDPVARTARVEPGVVHADLQRAAAPHGLRFGPDPSSHSRCTIGGMIGNNACGSRALGYGRTVDNVESLRVLYGNGELALEQGGRPGGATARRLAAVGDANLLHLRTEFGRFGRQVSGYGLEHLLPEGRRIERFLVGSEGSLATVLEATVRLVDDRVERRMLVLGYPTMADAADAVPALLAAVPGLPSRARAWTRASSIWCARRARLFPTCRGEVAGCSRRW